MSKNNNRFYRLLLLCTGVALGASQSAAIAAEDIGALPDNHWITSDKLDGLVVFDNKQNIVHRLAGNYEALDTRVLQSDSALVIASNTEKNSLDLFRWQKGQLALLAQQPVADSAVETLCLYQDTASASVYAFVAKHQQFIEQRLVFDLNQQQPLNIKVRDIPMAFGVSSCTVDDISGSLYVAEETIGVWHFDADPEAELERQPIAMLKPFGQLDGEIKGVQILSDSSLLITQPDAHKIARFKPVAADGLPQLDWMSVQGKVESLQGYWNKAGVLQLATLEEGAFHLQTFPKARQVKAREWQKERQKDKMQVARSEFAKVHPTMETLPVARHGDAADDPAIWVHPSVPEKSLILGTDKKAGLAVYSLDGSQKHFIPTGRLNNVDIRDGFRFQGKEISLAAASNRDHNSIALYAISPAGNVSELGEVITNLDEVYGICMYRNLARNEHHVLINDKDGRYQQYRIFEDGSRLAGKLLREFKLHDQPEGCVANDLNDTLFVGVEDHGVWVTSALAEQPATLTEVLTVGGNYQDDIEGLALYHRGEKTLLVVSSQGNDSYAILDAKPPFKYHGSVQITANSELGIDGASETDGLEVTSVNLGDGYSQGVLVVQDGRNVMPVEPQNFKLVPFADILAVLNIQ